MTDKPSKSGILFGPLFWGMVIFVIGTGLGLAVAEHARVQIETGVLVPPPPQAAPVPLIVFFVAVALLGILLLIIPIRRMGLVLRILFIVLYAWGIFVLLFLFAPQLWMALVPAALIGAAWFLYPRVWLHDLLLVLALASVGVVFGLIIKPWTAIIILGVISVYDFVAVRLGYMMWMAKKMSESDTLPVFILPKERQYWTLNLTKGEAKRLMEGEGGRREVSILGGGDIGFPLVLANSVFFDVGITKAIIVAAFSLLGLVSAFVIQQRFLKDKPLPAIPPITVASLIGFLLVTFVMK